MKKPSRGMREGFFCFGMIGKRAEDESLLPMKATKCADARGRGGTLD